MDIATDFALVALGGLVLYFGAEWLVRGAAGLARAFGLREIVVGLTVVAYGTSAPELAVSISANLGGSSPLVFGNVIGSCVANLGLILGVTAVIAPPMVEHGLLRREVPVLLSSAFILPIMLYNGFLGRGEALLLLGCAIAYSLLTFVSAMGSATVPEWDTEESDAAEDTEEDENLGKAVLVGLTIVGLAMLIGGGELFVRGAQGLAKSFGMSDRLIGLTVVAFGTSLPELAASLVAALRGHSALAIGNVIGSNIFNIFLVVGTSGSIRPMAGSFEELKFDFLFLGGITLFGAIAMHTKRTITRAEGILLLATYVAFIVLAAVGW